jgi:hypothetical protein
MKQLAYEFDNSVAAEGFRQAQTVNEHPFSHEQHDAWLAQFMSHARKVFGLPAQPKNPISDFAQHLEQLGYFGFAHYVRTHTMHKPDPHLLPQTQSLVRAKNQYIF